MGELLGMRVTAEVDSELLATDFLGGERSVCDKVDLAVGFNAMLKEAEAQDEPDVDFDDSAPLKPTEEDALYLLR
jgi:hypothetical protein